MNRKMIGAIAALLMLFPFLLESCRLKDFPSEGCRLDVALSQWKAQREKGCSAKILTGTDATPSL